MTFVERIGGVLVAPARTFAALADGEARGSDVAWLLLLRLVAEQAPRLVRAVVRGWALGLMAGMQSVAAATTDLLPDVIAIFVAGGVMALFVPPGARGHGRAFDLAAYAWVPYLAVELVGALGYTARGELPAPAMRHLIDGAALAAAVIAWATALVAARRPAEAA